jgi:hypothetical protein
LAFLVRDLFFVLASLRQWLALDFMGHSYWPPLVVAFRNLAFLFFCWRDLLSASSNPVSQIPRYIQPANQVLYRK